MPHSVQMRDLLDSVMRLRQVGHSIFLFTGVGSVLLNYFTSFLIDQYDTHYISQLGVFTSFMAFASSEAGVKIFKKHGLYLD